LNLAVIPSRIEYVDIIYKDVDIIYKEEIQAEFLNPYCHHVHYVPSLLRGRYANSRVQNDKRQFQTDAPSFEWQLEGGWMQI